MSCPFAKEEASVSEPPPKIAETPDQYKNIVDKAKDEKDQVYYGNYLRLPELLELQQPLSRIGESKKPAHEELLFIITHQTYELWFKQIHHEISSIVEMFLQATIHDHQMLTIINRLDRSVEIMKVLCQQFNILEMMYPQDFLEFREFLIPASGFQSKQFRLLENRLGLKPELRMSYQDSNYTIFFAEKDQKSLEESHEAPTLFGVVEQWLERTPFLQSDNFPFWEKYREAVRNMLDSQRSEIKSNTFFKPEEKKHRLEEFEKNNTSFAALLDEEDYTKRFKDLSSHRHFSYKAIQAVLLIFLYRNQPMLQLPFKLLSSLIDFDEMLMTWRFRHAQMVQRMIGVKIGTGGSSGYHYLRSTISDRYKVFVDLFHVPTYLLPSSQLPALPVELQEELEFSYTTVKKKKTESDHNNNHNNH